MAKIAQKSIKNMNRTVVGVSSNDRSIDIISIASETVTFFLFIGAHWRRDLEEGAKCRGSKEKLQSWIAHATVNCGISWAPEQSPTKPVRGFH